MTRKAAVAAVAATALLPAGCSAKTSYANYSGTSWNITWSVSCNTNISFLKAIEAWWYGKQRFMMHLQMENPCRNLEIGTVNKVVIRNGKNQPRAFPSHGFLKIATATFKNWSLTVYGTPGIAQAWAKSKTNGQYQHENGGESVNTGKYPALRVSWPRLLRNAYSIYRYVLASPPPKTRFFFYLFPADQAIEKTKATSTDQAVVLPFFIPYTKSGLDQWPGLSVSAAYNGTPLNPRQITYYLISVCMSFEYMHALFFTKRVKAANYLGSAVPGAIIMDILPLIYWQRCARCSMSILGSKAALKHVRSKEASLLREGLLDAYAGLLADANMAHALGHSTKKITIHTGDRAKVIRLLKLARAMLQQPVDLTEQKLYPLQNLESVPAYTGTIKKGIAQDSSE